MIGGSASPRNEARQQKRWKKPRRPDGYFREWEQNRLIKTKKLKREFKKIRAWIKRYLKSHPEHEHLKPVMMLWAMMKWYCLSIRGMIDELHYRRGALKVVCLRRVPSKSWLHKWMHRLPLEMLDAPDPVHRMRGCLRQLLGRLGPPQVQPVPTGGQCR